MFMGANPKIFSLEHDMINFLGMNRIVDRNVPQSDKRAICVLFLHAGKGAAGGQSSRIGIIHVAIMNSDPEAASLSAAPASAMASHGQVIRHPSVWW